MLKPRVAELGSRVQTLGGNRSASPRGYNYRWQKERLVYLAAHPLCVFCEREGRATAAAVVDHIVPHQGDQKLFWDVSNWQSLCVSCHSSTKQRLEAGVNKF